MGRHSVDPGDEHRRGQPGQGRQEAGGVGAAAPSRFASRTKVAEGGRLVWYGPQSTPEAWLAYWQDRIGPAYYDKARTRDLRRHPLGRVLLAELDRGGLHLEAGCGAGFWVAALSAAGYQVEGIDSSAPLVELVTACAPELDVRHGDALAIDRPDGHYDSYLSFGVVEHRPEGPEPFLIEARRVLKPGGLLVVSVPHFGPLRRAKARPGSPPPGRPFYQYGFTLAELRRLVEAAGFAVRRALPIEPHRLLEEESRAYERLAQSRAGGRLKDMVEAACSRFDGHMAVVVANSSRSD